MLSVLLRADDGTVFRTIQPGETGMEANVEAPSVQTRKDYTSRPGALSRFFRMSRDGWKSKYKDLYPEVPTPVKHCRAFCFISCPLSWFDGPRGSGHPDPDFRIFSLQHNQQPFSRSTNRRKGGKRGRESFP
jgi:hypothetical protein